MFGMVEPTPVNRKSRALLFLRRHLKELEAKSRTPDAESLAMAGVPYSQRIAMGFRADEAEKQHEAEIAAFEDAIAFVEAAAE
jgi:hypothetical protein